MRYFEFGELPTMFEDDAGLEHMMSHLVFKPISKQTNKTTPTPKSTTPISMWDVDGDGPALNELMLGEELHLSNFPTFHILVVVQIPVGSIIILVNCFEQMVEVLVSLGPYKQFTAKWSCKAPFGNGLGNGVGCELCCKFSRSCGGQTTHFAIFKMSPNTNIEVHHRNRSKKHLYALNHLMPRARE